MHATVCGEHARPHLPCVGLPDLVAALLCCGAVEGAALKTRLQGGGPHLLHRRRHSPLSCGATSRLQQGWVMLTQENIIITPRTWGRPASHRLCSHVIRVGRKAARAMGLLDACKRRGLPDPTCAKVSARIACSIVGASNLGACAQAMFYWLAAPLGR